MSNLSEPYARRRQSTRARLLPLLLFLATLTVAGRAADAGPGRHPLYGDGNTLRWYANLREAQTVAAREGKLLVVDVTVPNDPTCEMAIGLIQDAAIRARIARVAVGYHVDGRRSSQFARDFRRNLRSTAYYPWVGFFSSDARWVSGFAASRRTSRVELRRRFLVALNRAEAVQRRLRPQAGRSPAAAASRTTRARAAPKSTTAAPKRSTGTAGGLVWYEKISEAQAAARAQGKIILVTSTKPTCGLCKKLIQKIVPQAWARMSQGCVCYVYDITNPESKAVDRLVRRNHIGHRLMPLAGFMTADLRWLHGFYGGTDARQLTADYRQAQQAARR